MKENVTTPAGQEARVSMLRNPEAFKVCVCICVCVHSTCIKCVLCVHTCLHSRKTLSATLFICTVGPVIHPGYKGDACIFHHTITTTVFALLTTEHVTYLPLFLIMTDIKHKRYIILNICQAPLILSYFYPQKCSCLHLG